MWAPVILLCHWGSPSSFQVSSGWGRPCSPSPQPSHYCLYGRKIHPHSFWAHENPTARGEGSLLILFNPEILYLREKLTIVSQVCLGSLCVEELLRLLLTHLSSVGVGRGHWWSMGCWGLWGYREWWMMILPSRGCWVEGGVVIGNSANPQGFHDEGVVATVDIASPSGIQNEG